MQRLNAVIFSSGCRFFPSVRCDGYLSSVQFMWEFTGKKMTDEFYLGGVCLKTALGESVRKRSVQSITEQPLACAGPLAGATWSTTVKCWSQVCIGACGGVDPDFSRNKPNEWHNTHFATYPKNYDESYDCILTCHDSWSKPVQQR